MAVCHIHGLNVSSWKEAVLKEYCHYNHVTDFDLSCSNVLIQVFLPYLEALRKVIFNEKVLHMYVGPFPILFR